MVVVVLVSEVIAASTSIAVKNVVISVVVLDVGKIVVSVGNSGK